MIPETITQILCIIIISSGSLNIIKWYNEEVNSDKSNINRCEDPHLSFVKKIRFVFASFIRDLADKIEGIQTPTSSA